MNKSRIGVEYMDHSLQHLPLTKTVTPAECRVSCYKAVSKITNKDALFVALFTKIDVGSNFKIQFCVTWTTISITYYNVVTLAIIVKKVKVAHTRLPSEGFRS